MSEHESPSAWRAFWNRGTWWKAVLAAVVYLALFLGAGWLTGQLFGSQFDDGGVFASEKNVFLALTLPLLVGAVVLIAFIASLGWFGPLFGRQPIGGRWWMWIAVAIPVSAILLRLIGIDYGAYTPGVVALTFFTGLLIGFTEEVLTRGIAVKLLRDSGMRELGVAVISSALFALLHSANLLSGMAPLTVALTVGYTFMFGVLMYLTMRVTGSIVWAIVVHGLTDPTLFLASGGVDVAAANENVFLALAAPVNFVTIGFGVIALFLIRGRVGSRTVDGIEAPAAKLG